MPFIETVKVKHATLGHVVINKSDFDPEAHELYVEPVVAKEEIPNAEIEKEEVPVTPVEPEMPSAIAQKTGEPVIPDFSANKSKKR
jgi:hypothetical protein